MSIRFLTWAFQLRLKDMAAKGVLAALADHADENGRSWPSIERLALFTGCGVNTARRALLRLVDLGLVDRVARPGKSDVFVLRMDVDPSQKRPSAPSSPTSMGPPTMGPPTVGPPNEAATPPNVTDDPSQREPDPYHGGSRTLMNRQGTLRTRARGSEPNCPQEVRLPDTAKWAERLAGYRPWEGKTTWLPFWGPRPDSSGRDNPLIPPSMLATWRAEYRAARAKPAMA